MNEKIDKDFNSFEFINKVSFYIFLFTLFGGILLQLLFLKNSVNLFNLPFLIAADLSNHSFITNGSIFNYFNYSSAFIFSVIFYYFIIPFNFIFSANSAIKLLKQRPFSIKLFNYEIINFIISSIFIFVLIFSLAYFSLIKIEKKDQIADLKNKLLDAKFTEVVNNFALGAREKMVLPSKYNGWSDITPDKLDIYKQYNANYINAFINDTTNKFIVRVIPQKIEINYLSLILTSKNLKKDTIIITPTKHTE